MHSRIYQITTSPIHPPNYISESDFCEHWFIGSIADYVDGGLDREDELDSIKQSLTRGKVAMFHNDECFSILPRGKEAYFKRAFEEFSEAVKKAADVTLEEFVRNGDFSSLVYRIKNSFCEKFSYYVSSEEFDTIPFDEFVRDAEHGRRYYIGGILDYHF